MFWTTKKFKSLEKSWYKKLKEEGFVDIEKTVGNKPVLITKSRTLIDDYSKQEYYRQVQARIGKKEKFDCRADSIIMKHVAKGWMIKDISTVLTEKGLKSHRETIRTIIRRYEDRWNIRKWTAII